MSELKQILREADPRMLVQLTVEELRAIVGAVVEEKIKARLVNGSAPGLLNTEQAANFLGYSVDWVYKNWAKIGGRKIGKRGVRFDAVDLQKWVESRKGSRNKLSV